MTLWKNKYRSNYSKLYFTIIVKKKILGFPSELFLSLKSITVTIQTLIDHLRPRLIVTSLQSSSKSYFFRLVRNSALFLAPFCCSSLLHVVANCVPGCCSVK